MHRPLLGNYSLNSLEIKSHSLRISYPRVDKEDLTVPSADIPQGWGKFLHVAYCEFKVPASHTLQGETFAAEMNCYIIQKAGRGLGVFTILFEIGSFNKLLDEAICSFQSVWQKDKNACSGGGRRDLEEDGKDDDDVFDDDDDDVAPRNHESTINWMIENLIFREDPQGNVLDDPKCGGGGWNPFEFMYQTKSWHFYGYKGTLMEPPCSQIVEHRVFDTPAEMSIGQLEDMKKILFTHQDPRTCQYTSVHNKFESVARPLQPSQRSRIHRCTCRDFISDEQRRKEGRKSCRAGTEKQWMPNPTDLVPARGEQWDL
mmetsp:Transcript_34542/g.45786  ORF Transcript_34542/g.45786 Transcript_34542/m.45786 type:complete len:315 (+) Transcript_34542:2-946(+)